jgi:TonB family protein
MLNIYLTLFISLIFYGTLFSLNSTDDEAIKVQLKEIVKNRKIVNSLLKMEFDITSFQQTIFSNTTISKPTKQIYQLESNSIERLNKLVQLDSNYIFQDEKIINILGNEYMFNYLLISPFTKQKKALKSLPNNLYDDFYNSYLVSVLELSDSSAVVFTNSTSEYFCLNYLQLKKGIRNDVSIVYASDLNKFNQFSTQFNPKLNAIKITYGEVDFLKLKDYSIKLNRHSQKVLATEKVKELLISYNEEEGANKELDMSGFKLFDYSFLVSKKSGFRVLTFIQVMFFDIIESNSKRSFYLLKDKSLTSYSNIYFRLKNHLNTEGYASKINPLKNKYIILDSTHLKVQDHLLNCQLKDIFYTKTQESAIYNLSHTYDRFLEVENRNRNAPLYNQLLNAFGERVAETSSFPSNPLYALELLNNKEDDKTIEIVKQTLKDKNLITEKGYQELISAAHKVMIKADRKDLSDALFDAGYKNSDILKICESNGKFGIYTLNNRVICQPIYDQVTLPFYNYSIVQLAGKFGVIDMSERYILPCSYDTIYRMESFLEKIVIVKSKGKMGVDFIGLTSRIPMMYDEIDYWSYDSHIIIRKGEKYGLYQKYYDDYIGKNIVLKNNIDCKYDSIKVHIENNKEHFYLYQGGNTISLDSIPYRTTNSKIVINPKIGDYVAKTSIPFETEIDIKNKVYDFTQIEPFFLTGKPAMEKYIAANIIYPESLKEKGTKGKVYIRFTVEKNGSISDIKIIKGLAKELDAEALRIVNSMKTWTPGKMEDRDVRAKYIITIYFQP